MSNQSENKVVLVTGASKGTGVFKDIRNIYEFCCN
jgi:selenocysteine lyase/cysteine desulfurase